MSDTRLRIIISTVTTGMQQALGGAAGMFGRLGTAVSSMLGPLGLAATGIAAVGFAIVGVSKAIVSSVKEFAVFEQKMLFVNTIARQTTTQLKETADGVRDLAKQYGVSANDLSKSLYDIYSNVGETGKNLQILEAATQASVAGMADLQTTGAALTGVINAMGMTAAESTKILDIQFKTIERGKLTYDELASSQGMFLSAAKGAGQSLEGTMAMFATVTKGLQNVSMSATGMANTFKRFVNPEFKQQLQSMFEIEIDVTDAEGNFREIMDVFIDLQKEFSVRSEGAGAEMIAELFPNIRAQRAIKAIFANWESALIDAVYVTQRYSGTLETVLSGMMSATQKDMDQLGQAFTDLKLAVGEDFADNATDLLTALTDLVDRMSTKLDMLQGKWDKMASFAGKAAGLVEKWVPGGASGEETTAAAEEKGKEAFKATLKGYIDTAESQESKSAIQKMAENLNPFTVVGRTVRQMDAFKGRKAKKQFEKLEFEDTEGLDTLDKRIDYYFRLADAWKEGRATLSETQQLMQSVSEMGGERGYSGVTKEEADAELARIKDGAAGVKESHEILKAFVETHSAEKDKPITPEIMFASMEFGEVLSREEIDTINQTLVDNFYESYGVKLDEKSADFQALQAEYFAGVIEKGASGTAQEKAIAEFLKGSEEQIKAQGSVLGKTFKQVMADAVDEIAGVKLTAEMLGIDKEEVQSSIVSIFRGAFDEAKSLFDEGLIDKAQLEEVASLYREAKKELEDTVDIADQLDAIELKLLESKLEGVDALRLQRTELEAILSSLKAQDGATKDILRVQKELVRNTKEMARETKRAADEAIDLLRQEFDMKRQQAQISGFGDKAGISQSMIDIANQEAAALQKRGAGQKEINSVILEGLKAQADLQKEGARREKEAQREREKAAKEQEKAAKERERAAEKQRKHFEKVQKERKQARISAAEGSVRIAEAEARLRNIQLDSIDGLKIQISEREKLLAVYKQEGVERSKQLEIEIQLKELAVELKEAYHPEIGIRRTREESERTMQAAQMVANLTGEEYDAAGEKVRMWTVEVEELFKAKATGTAEWTKAIAELEFWTQKVAENKAMEDFKKKAEEDAKFMKDALKGALTTALDEGAESGVKAFAKKLGDAVKERMMDALTESLLTGEGMSALFGGEGGGMGMAVGGGSGLGGLLSSLSGGRGAGPAPGMFGGSGAAAVGAGGTGAGGFMAQGAGAASQWARGQGAAAGMVGQGAGAAAAGGGGGLMGMMGGAGGAGGMMGMLGQASPYIMGAMLISSFFKKGGGQLAQSGVKPIDEGTKYIGGGFDTLYGSDTFERASYSARNKTGDVGRKFTNIRMGDDPQKVEVDITMKGDADDMFNAAIVEGSTMNELRGVSPRTGNEYG